MNKIREYINRITKKQWIIAGGVFAILVIMTATGIIFYQYQKELRQAAKEQEENKPKEELVIETIQDEPETMEVIQQSRNISFSGTSIEKDLKIKIVDEYEKLISGVAFKVFVAPEGSEHKKKEYVDEDMDGLIHITGIAAGKYVVTLEEQEHFIIAQNPIVMEVKGKIEYKKVDVTAEVKKDSEVNTKVEDTGNSKPQVERPIANTLPFLESTVSRESVDKKKVSVDNFPAALSEGKQEETFGATNVQVPQSVTLYSQGGEKSKSYAISPYNMQTRDVTIQGITWSINDGTVAAIQAHDDHSVTVSALQSGQAVVYCTISFLDENGVPNSKVLTITIEVDNVDDNSTQLLDLDGNELYLDSEAKQVATLKDYGDRNTFYGRLQYTGWQTIDGATYYYNENHEAVTGQQVIGYFKYSFDASGKLIESLETKGIDVSKWQADIDWKAVAGAGIDFAIIRVGYRGSETGVLVEDPYFKANIAGATKAGVKVGVYFFTQAITEAEAVEEASMAMELVKGYRLDYPIYIDTEWSGGRADNLSKTNRTKIVKAFCKTVQNGGYKAGVYASKYWYLDNLHADELKDYTIWVAQYNTECTYTGKYDMWQYTDKGRVPGIKGNVDLNICYKGR